MRRRGILLLVTETPYRARSISEKQRFSEAQYLSLSLSLSSSISLSLSLSKTKNLKYLPSALPPAAGSGTMGTRDLNMGMGSDVAGGQLCVAGKLFANFDFWNRPNRVLEPRFRISLATVSTQSQISLTTLPKILI